jgi:hypothetical protein
MPDGFPWPFVSRTHPAIGWRVRRYSPVRRRVIARLNVWGGGLTLRKTADKLSSTRAEFDNTSRNILYSQGRAF